MGSFVAILFRSAPANGDLPKLMLEAAPHRGVDLAVKVYGSCALGISNGREIIDSAISSEGRLLAALQAGSTMHATWWPPLLRQGFLRAPKILPISSLRHSRLSVQRAPDRFRGAFAAAVTDGKELWCFRDHLGLRSAFYREDPKGVFIASEPKQIVAGTGISRQPNLDVLELTFYGRLTKDTPSAIKGIERIPKATVLHAKPSAVVKRPSYWRPTKVFETARLAPGEVGEAFADVFRKVMRRSLTGHDVVAMSGGIDSPAIAAYAAPLHHELMGRPLAALSHVYPDHPKVDERKYIELIAHFLKMELHTCTPTAGPWQDVAHWCAIFDGPIHTLSLPEVTEFYKTARQLGFRNVYTGDVAEVVFDRSEHILSYLLTHGRWNALATLLRTLRKQGSTWRGLGQSMATTFIPGRFANWYLHARGLDYPQRIPSWIDAKKVNETSFRTDFLQPAHRRWAHLQLGPFMEGAAQTLEADDVCGLLCGIYVRRPFADIDVSEFFLSLPAEVKFPDKKPKTLMRRILRGKLPDQILDRRDKTVFNDYTLSRIDYATAKKFLINPTFRMPGVNYDALAERIESRTFNIVDHGWANDLVRIHAFLSLW